MKELTAINQSFTPPKQEKNIVRRVLISIGLGSLVATNLVMYWTFLTAYLNPSKSVNILINNFGEAHFELILISITTIISLITCYLILKEERDRFAQSN